MNSNVDFWEFWGYLALGAVVIGVIGESIEEFTDWPKRKGLSKPLTRLSALVLILGLAAEGITQPNTNAANATLVALLNNETGTLALELQKEINKRSSRGVSDAQLSTLTSELSKVGGPFFVACRNEDEPRQYCDRIISSLDKANLINQNLAPPVFTNAPGDNWTGVKLYTPTISDKSNPKNDPFAKAFEKADIPINGICFESATCTLVSSPGTSSSSPGVILSMGLKDGHPSGNGVALDPGLNRPMRTIYIGQKPLPD